jgi:cytidylate kinase
MGVPLIVAIDGPAASGKSTLGKMLAEELGYLFFDTGIMYRAVTWLTLQGGIQVEDEAAITALAENTPIEVRPPSRPDGRAYDIWVEGEDITWEIRRPEVDANVSAVSAYKGVRQAMTVQQRRIGLRGQVVMVGRDIGTVVLPEAGLKIYLDASPAERARRRYQELIGRGEPAVYADILSAVLARDQIDSNREIAPLRAAQDAIIINSNNLDIDQVFNLVKKLVYQDLPVS